MATSGEPAAVPETNARLIWPANGSNAMHDPFSDLLMIHDAASAHGVSLHPELLDYLEQKSQTLAAIHTQPNVVPLGSTTSQPGPAQHVSDEQVAADNKLVRFPDFQDRAERRSRKTV